MSATILSVSHLPEGAIRSVPEPGQVVEVRGSTWAVAQVEQQGLPRSPADETVAGLNHAVTLQALDEDRLGEELTVVWELEVGHTVTPAQGLPARIAPDGFDDPNTLAGFVDAMRWGAVTSADDRSVQAPFHSGVAVEAYQLLADDVGLGKTIEAGLVIQELLLRHRARSVVVVCPPSLALKWQDEMRDKFGLDFTVVNSELMREVRRRYGLHANPFRLFPRVIVSMAWLPQVRAQRLLRDVYAQAANTAMLFKKRFLSSPWAFGMTLRSYLDTRAAGRGDFALDYDDILGEGQSDEEEGLGEQDEATALRHSKSTDPLVAARPGELDRLAGWGLGFESRPDARVTELITMLDAICRPAGWWSNERVVIFTEYAHTLEWLHRVLLKQGYGDVLAVIQGSTPTDDRELIRERFNADPAKERVRVLLATDAAGEGIDLQAHCHRLVNVDIPFNPSRLEQRIGRIDRYGQREPPEIFHFAPIRSSSRYDGDAAFMGLIARKVVTVARDLGSVNQVIAEDIQQHFAPTTRPAEEAGGG